MKAFVTIKDAAGARLEMRDVAEPAAGPGQILIAVKTVGLNRADIGHAAAQPGQPGVSIAGIEAAGEVVGVGSGVTRFKPGDRVMSMAVRSYAELVVAEAAAAMHVPAHFDFVQAAAIPVFFSTAHDALVTNGEMRAGGSVLIQSATAGVGIAMIQTAKALGASLIAGTSRSAQKIDALKRFGLDLALASGRDDVAEACKAATGGKGIATIIDNVGKGVLAQNMEAAAILGRIVSVGRLAGKLDEIDLDKLALKRLKLIGVTFRTRSNEQKAEITRRLWQDMGALFESGRIDPPVDRAFNFDDAAAAQDYMRANRHAGKIVLKL